MILTANGQAARQVSKQQFEFYRHTCGGFAFAYWNPVEHEQVRASQVLFLDGSEPKLFDLIRCGSCGGLVGCPETKHFYD